MSIEQRRRMANGDAAHASGAAPPRSARARSARNRPHPDAPAELPTGQPIPVAAGSVLQPGVPHEVCLCQRPPHHITSTPARKFPAPQRAARKPGQHPVHGHLIYQRGAVQSPAALSA